MTGRSAPRVWFVWQLYKNGYEEWDGPFDSFIDALKRLNDLVASESNLVTAQITRTECHGDVKTGRGYDPVTP